MKVVHLVAGELNGGAAKGALSLHAGLLELGVESYVINNKRIVNSELKNVITTYSGAYSRICSYIKRVLSNSFLLFYPNKKKEIFNTGIIGDNFSRNIIFKEADIVHMHWINGLVSISQINKIKKPIIWTIRDYWPLSGGCHVPMECFGYLSNCGSCPVLGSKCESDLSSKLIAFKARMYPRNIRLIAFSQFMERAIRRSTLFKNNPINIVPNSIWAYREINKLLARKILGLDNSFKYILIGAQGINEPWKGFDLFYKSIEFLKDKDKYKIIFFGNEDSSIFNDIDIEIIHMGFIQNEERLNYIYSSADVFVSPSKHETFGKTIAESMASGTPVVIFDAGGQADLVSHRDDGYKATPYSTRDLADGIVWILNLSKIDYARLRQNAVKSSRRFAYKTIAKRHYEIYKEMLNQ